MNKLLVTFALMALANFLPAPCSAAGESAAADPFAAAEEPVNDIYPRWSVVGEWRVTHPHWTDIVALRADGSLTTLRQQTTGRWILTADAGTPVLVFRWDLYGTESVAMVDPNHFRGQTQSGTFIDMRRGEKLTEKPAEDSKP